MGKSKPYSDRFPYLLVKIGSDDYDIVHRPANRPEKELIIDAIMMARNCKFKISVVFDKDNYIQVEPDGTFDAGAFLNYTKNKLTTVIKKPYKIPEEFVKCEVCGEYNGKTLGKNLNWEGSYWENQENSLEFITVTCLCHGILCGYCHKNMIHRPISNSYDEKTNTIGHWPYFSGQAPCRECRKKANPA